MKKIGILTLPLHNNYGGILQAFALQRILKDNGYNAFLLIQHGSSLWSFKKSKLTQIKYWIKKNINYNDDTSLINKDIQKFIEDKIHPKFEFWGKKKIEKGRFDAIVIGSDQIWRGKEFYAVADAYMAYLNKSSIPRIAYGASFGLAAVDYSENEVEVAKTAIKNYKAVSVREISGVNICKKKLNRTPSLVLDPTLLLDKSVYVRLVKEKLSVEQNKMIYYYILNPKDDKYNVVKMIENLLNKKSYTVFNHKFKDKSLPLEGRIVPSLEDWLSGFICSDFVVTDSFHGAVFSILFNKPFLVYGSVKGGLTRFETLLGYFDLENRYITNSSELSIDKVSSEIDWEILNRKLFKLKSNSIRFLLDALK